MGKGLRTYGYGTYGGEFYGNLIGDVETVIAGIWNVAAEVSTSWTAVWDVREALFIEYIGIWGVRSYARPDTDRSLLGPITQAMVDDARAMLATEYDLVGLVQTRSLLAQEQFSALADRLSALGSLSDAALAGERMMLANTTQSMRDGHRSMLGVA